jgi:ribonuclease HI
MLFQPEFIIYVDGASRGNPGDASYGFAILDSNSNVIYQEGKYIGQTTNNVAEYTALVRALQYAIDHKIPSVEIRADSQLLVRQLLGQYKVKSENLEELHRACRALLQQFKWYELNHIPREQNKLADKLANQALDERKKSEISNGKDEF